MVSTASPFDHVGDLFAIVSLFLVGTVFLALAGLDPGTAFGGMGASREMTVAALAEPTLLLAVFAIAGRAESSNLAAIVTATLHAAPQRRVRPEPAWRWLPLRSRRSPSAPDYRSTIRARISS